MKPRPLKMGMEVRVCWDDACSHAGWMTEDDPDLLLMNHPVRSLGFVHGSNKRYLRITMSTAAPDDAKPMRGGILAIPWGCITKLEKL